MWMSGFQILDEHTNRPCVALLFEGWDLNTKFKFVIGCFGTFGMGLFVEFLVYTRRQVKRRFMNGQMPKLHFRIISGGMLLLYLVQVSIGYMLMLVAMTYQVELFLMVVFGLTVGHGAFNMSGPVLESAEACCQGFDPDNQETISSRNLDALIDSPLGQHTNGWLYASNTLTYEPPSVDQEDVFPSPSCCSNRNQLDQ